MTLLHRKSKNKRDALIGSSLLIVLYCVILTDLQHQTLAFDHLTKVG